MCSSCFLSLDGSPMLAAFAVVVEIVIVGGFHHRGVEPIGFPYIRKMPQLLLVVGEERRVRGAPQHVVGDGRNLRAGDRLVRTERTVAIARDPAVLNRAAYDV